MKAVLLSVRPTYCEKIASGEKTEIKKKIAKTLCTRSDKINLTSIVTDEDGASIVKFTFARNCDTYLALISSLGNMQLYRQV